MRPTIKTPYDHCISYIESQLRRKVPHPPLPLPSVTIAREEGARGHAIAHALVEWLQKHDTAATTPWALFDRDLVQRILADNQLPARLADHMPEDQVSEFDSMIGELLRDHPPQWELFQMTGRTIVRFAKMGHAVIVGRCGNLLTAHLPHVVHFRLVGTPAIRAAHLAASRQLPFEEARRMMESEDRARARYLHAHFDRSVEDPLLYDLILNTDRIDDATAARLLGERVLAARHNHAPLVPPKASVA